MPSIGKDREIQVWRSPGVFSYALLSRPTDLRDSVVLTLEDH